ncbi:MAG: hypothetical protein QXL10_02320 [Candidatus Bathyarchaeia archaeon]|nr:hypothetical protein [Candidatus Bathyarchaeota archaeon]
MAAEKEIYSWLFVNTIPLLYEEKKIERQSKIEHWLNLYQLTREIDALISEEQNGGAASYVV